MTTLNLHHIMNPRSIAVIGASEQKGSVGAVCTAVLDLAMRENVGFSAMLTLGKKLGFGVKLDPESSESKLEIYLKDLK